MNKAELEAFKAAHPILDVLRELGVQTANHRFRCPRPERHKQGDRTPSVTVWPERGWFKCWVCPDVKGDVIDLVRLIRGGSFREALDFLGHGPAGARPAHAHGHSEAAPLPTSERWQLPASVHGAGVPTPAKPESQTELFAGGDPFPAETPAHSNLHVTQSRSDPGNTQVTPRGIPEGAGAAPDSGEDLEALRRSVLASLLEFGEPVGGKAARYLQKRRIFRRTWDAQNLRMIEDYGMVSDRLKQAFGTAALERTGFFNAAGHLRYYRHRLLFPYFDRAGKAVYMQARTVEPEVKPKELSMSGPIPLPYNVRLLDEAPGHVYLCEGVIDTLTLLEQGFPAVGVPGAANFKPAWAPLFRNKTVHVAFDPDAPGEAGAARAIDLLHAEDVEAKRFTPPKGMDLNDWFRKG